MNDRDKGSFFVKTGRKAPPTNPVPEKDADSGDSSATTESDDAERLREAQRQNPYILQGGGCNW